jgi:deazaflavin-dependent oxidoreductase (nitroreductase family)
MTEPQYLYLTTIGWKSGQPHEIEIWFVRHAGCYYLVSEKWARSHWVQNIQCRPAVTFRVDGTTYTGSGRVIANTDEPERAAAVSQLMETKYGWSDGLIVELCPADS